MLSFIQVSHATLVDFWLKTDRLLQRRAPLHASSDRAAYEAILSAVWDEAATADMRNDWVDIIDQLTGMYRSKKDEEARLAGDMPVLKVADAPHLGDDSQDSVVVASQQQTKQSIPGAWPGERKEIEVSLQPALTNAVDLDPQYVKRAESLDHAINTAETRRPSAGTSPREGGHAWSYRDAVTADTAPFHYGQLGNSASSSRGRIQVQVAAGDSNLAHDTLSPESDDELERQLSAPARDLRETSPETVVGSRTTTTTRSSASRPHRAGYRSPNGEGSAGAENRDDEELSPFDLARCLPSGTAGSGVEGAAHRSRNGFTPTPASRQGQPGPRLFPHHSPPYGVRATHVDEAGPSRIHTRDVDPNLLASPSSGGQPSQSPPPFAHLRRNRVIEEEGLALIEHMRSLPQQSRPDPPRDDRSSHFPNLVTHGGQRTYGKGGRKSGSGKRMNDDADSGGKGANSKRAKTADTVEETTNGGSMEHPIDIESDNDA